MKVQRLTMSVCFLVISSILLLAACDRGSINDPSQLPTAINPETSPTEFFLTENAPPTGFSTISFPQIDSNLNLLSGGRYEMTLRFDGRFTSVDRETNAETTAEVWFNQIGSSRRVVLQTTGELIGQEENPSFEAVRLGPDVFLVRDGTCLTNAGDDAVSAADLSAGSLIGGVSNAQPTGRHAVMNSNLGAEAWQYTFTNDDLVLPTIHPAEGGSVTMAEQGEIWVSPQYNVVVRFYVTLNVENTIVFDRQLPVNGQVIIRYDLFDIGVAPNINVPFGC